MNIICVTHGCCLQSAGVKTKILSDRDGRAKEKFISEGETHLLSNITAQNVNGFIDKCRKAVWYIEDFG